MERSVTQEDILHNWRERKIKVFRITVDEKLSDDYIRLMICSLIESIKDFADKETKRIVITDRRRNWDKEEEVYITSENYKDILGMLGLKKKHVEQIPWDNLNEGQVYLLGSFRIEEIKKRTNLKQAKIDKENRKRKVKRFILDARKVSFTQIDEQVNDAIRRLYFSTLRERRKHASTD